MRPIDLRLSAYVKRRMAQREISEDAIRWVLEHYDTSHPARYRNGPTVIFVGEYGGRRLKVYVVRDTNPPLVTTVVWQGENP